ncbi:hypothetical protein ACLJ4N_001605 [Campylobacter coli]|nr:hypothetical protein [Campylobacter coli]EAH8795891.1 hypothetical protein [Campylobacter coli]EAH9529284.1 hypothetical protein [Campylobacter coli]EAI2288464.1 hypothetical protein [Campylobacter coli]EAI7658350.1 hypothetical protein [Campylobacter coli]EAI7664134.1 hypothetical protein [Campylobacter coli]
MQLSIRKKMLMLGAICFISMLATFAIFYYNNLKGSQKIAQTTKNLINKEIDIKVELLTKLMAIALGDLIKDVDDEKEKIKISLPQLKILDLKRIKADTFLSIKKQPSKPILLEKT